MGINTVQGYLQGALNGMTLPLNLGTLAAYVLPPVPGDGGIPTAYIWGSRGVEDRLATPRAAHGAPTTGGTKELVHQVDVWLVWHGSTEHPQASLQFPAIVDAVLATLRNLPILDAQAHATDPATGALSQLMDCGESMGWEYGPAHATEDQRMLRFDAQITVTLHENIQA